MSSNSTGSGGSVKAYRERWGAYEQCSPALREAMQNSGFSYSSAWLRDIERKYGTRKAIQTLKDSDEFMAKKQWIPGKWFKGHPAYVPAIYSSFVEANVPVLRG